MHFSINQVKPVLIADGKSTAPNRKIDEGKSNVGTIQEGMKTVWGINTLSVS